MTYCIGIFTREGLVMASDSRTNAGNDQVNVCRKMHTFVREGDRALVLLTSGSLSLTQSIVTLLRREFDAGDGLAKAASLYEAAKYALISLDSTMRSNATVGPPIDLCVYGEGELAIKRHRRLGADDLDLKAIRAQWEHSLRKAVLELPSISFD